MDDINLQIIKKRLLELANNYKNYTYYIPSIWLNYKEKENSIIKINPIEYFILKINQIYDIRSNNRFDNFKVSQSVIYNFIPRLFTAFDHNGDGKIESACDKTSFRETGTFLKTITMLPYIKMMGINTIHILPIFEIGKAHKRGNLGSIYAIKNIYKFDVNLSEPVLQLTIEQEFAALVEAAHLLGIKIVLEFIFRTASLDSDLILEHPDWFYWIYSKNNDKILLPPKFSKRIYNQILEKISVDDFSNLPEPSRKYINHFSQTPISISLNDGEYIGMISDSKTVRIPNGFSDWPPNDAQPIWRDVTYLKLYNHQNFNYIAYNTIRMYSSELVREENKVKELWDYIESVIPYYIENYGIDGAMIDMGHSLPPELLSNIISKAREVNEDFIFFEENFELSISSKKKGFDAVFGPLFLIENDFLKLKQFLKNLENNTIPIPFFSTSENHNTPRTYAVFEDVNFSKMIFVLNSLLPGLLFIHSGFELLEKKPINTGLNFSKNEIKKYIDEDLALFSISSLNWNKKDKLVDFISKGVEIRKELLNNSPYENATNFRLYENWHFIELELKSAPNSQTLYFIAKIDDTRANTTNFDIDLNDIILSIGVKYKDNRIKFEKYGFLLYKK